MMPEIVQPATGCTFPEANSQQGLGPTAVASSIYFGGVLPIAPVGDNFKFTITQGGTTASYSSRACLTQPGDARGTSTDLLLPLSMDLNTCGTRCILQEEKPRRAY
jgi:hypothetical protein